jgi:hypothetical protein
MYKDGADKQRTRISGGEPLKRPRLDADCCAVEEARKKQGTARVGEKRNACRVLVGNPDGKRQFTKPSRR